MEIPCPLKMKYRKVSFNISNVNLHLNSNLLHFVHTSAREIVKDFKTPSLQSAVKETGSSTDISACPGK